MCLKPPLPGVPEGQKICSRCVQFVREVQPVKLPQRVLFPCKAAPERGERAKKLVGRRVRRECQVSGSEREKGEGGSLSF